MDTNRAEQDSLHFWNYEFSRLAYWIPLAGGAFAIVLAFWYVLPGMRRYSLLLPVALAFALGVEWITSASYWRALSIEQAISLGWSSEFNYILEHLLLFPHPRFSWLFWIRRKSSERSISSH